MKHLNFCLTVLSISVSTSLFSQTTYVDNGTSSTYTLQTGDSLYIKQGTFTGKIEDWNNGGKVTVAAGATFNPNTINGLRSKYVIHGTAVFSSISSDGGFGLNNYGTVTINGGVQVNSSSQVWTNNNSAVLTIKGSFAFNSAASNSTLTNHGEIDIANEFNIYGDVTVQNSKSIVVAGNFTANKGQITNGGLLFTSGTLALGETVYYTNTCRTGAENGININNSGATVHNSGLLWASYKKNVSSFTNNGTYVSSGRGVIKTGTFTNYNTMKGNGFMYILGKSTLGGSASVGVSGTTSDSLKIYTVNRTNTSQIFDNQWGTVYNNARYEVFQAPDTTASYQSCSVQKSFFATLPVVWSEFSVALSADITALSWTATVDAGTHFEVERSNNGVDFVSIAKVTSEQNTTTYGYEDKAFPPTHASVVYYRVKATEPNGTHKYTDVKSVRFSTEGGQPLQASPNPFSSVFTLNYKSVQKAVLTIKIYNTHGQLQVVKTTSVKTGSNSIVIAEAGSLAKGLYTITIAAGNATPVITKIIKQ